MPAHTTARARASRGLSLIEIVVVLAVMIVVLAVLVPSTGNMVGRAQAVQSAYDASETLRILHLWEASGGSRGGLTDAQIISALRATAPGDPIPGASESPEAALIRIQQ